MTSQQPHTPQKPHTAAQVAALKPSHIKRIVAHPCGAKCRDGHLCPNPPTRGKKRCRMHGGSSPEGIGHYAYKTGHTSKLMALLPKRMQSHYEESYNDKRLLEARSSIALIDARLADLLSQVDSSAGAEQWKELKDAWDELEYRSARQETDLMRAQLMIVGRLIKQGGRDMGIWHEIMDLLERRRRLTETEQKRLVAMQQMLTQEEARLMFSFVIEVIRRHVTDRRALSAISAEFRTLTVGDDVVTS